jgi:hypothetical protein
LIVAVSDKSRKAYLFLAVISVGVGDYFVARLMDEASAMARDKYGEGDYILEQDKVVLDAWFR